MTTIRVERRRRFATIDRRTVNDQRLTFAARGLLCWLLDKPDDWYTTAARLVDESPDGKYVVRRVLGELEALGYLTRSKRRDERSRYVAEWIVHEVPTEPHAEIAHGDQGCFPDVDQGCFPDVAPGLVSSPITETELTETENTHALAALGARESIDDLFAAFWSEYPRKASKRTAAAAFVRALRRADFETIMTGVRRYRADPNRTPGFTKHAPTWLNGDCWTDEPLPPRRDGSRVSGGDLIDATAHMTEEQLLATFMGDDANGHDGNDPRRGGEGRNALPDRAISH